MGLKEIFGKISGSERVGVSELDDYTELRVEEGETRFIGPERYLKVFKLKGFVDVDAAARELGDGNIVILDIKPLAERSMNELKHAVDEMKDLCVSMGGDIAGISEYHMIMTPPTIRIERSSESRAEDFEETVERVRKKMSK
ncbi:MAG: cell division protein SepF [Candidatus Hydrothermarchaeaceae archaeon]